MEETKARTEAKEQSAGGRFIAVALAVAVLGAVGYFVFGMPGMDHGRGDPVAGMGSMDSSDMAVDVDQFGAMMADADSLVVNVNVADEGSIDGTDTAIPYDRLVRDRRLPADKATSILLYGTTSWQAKEAATALMDAGFTDVFYLEGGMNAWVAAGRPVQ